MWMFVFLLLPYWIIYTLCNKYKSNCIALIRYYFCVIVKTLDVIHTTRILTGSKLH